MEKNNWIKWLQARIPALKESQNEFWISQALDGYLMDKQNQEVNKPYSIDKVCDHEVVVKEYSTQPYGTCLSCGQTVYK